MPPAVAWFLVASTIFDTHQTIYLPDKRFTSQAECFAAAADINKRWREEDTLGFASCKPDGLDEFP